MSPSPQPRGEGRQREMQGTTARHPIIAGFVLVLLLALTAHSQINNLLAGMHPEGVEQATTSTLTGGPMRWSTPSDIETALQTWAEWDDGEAARGGNVRLHESPTSMVGGAVIVDFVFIIPAYVILLIFIAGRLLDKIQSTGDAAVRRERRARREAERAKESLDALLEREADATALREADQAWDLAAVTHERALKEIEDTESWVRAVRWLRWAVLAAAVFDVLENVFMLLVVNAETTTEVGGFATPNPSSFVMWALVVASRGKWWPLIIGAGGLIYVALLRPDPGAAGKRWATSLPAYFRGLRAIRVALLSVVLTAFIIYGPLFADQMRDVIRRWTALHVLVTLFFVGLVASYVGVSARRIRLRLVTRTPRWDELSYSVPVADLSEAELLKQEQAFWRVGKARTMRAGQVLVAAGVGGLLTHLLFGFGRGLVIPAAFALVLGLLGAPLPQRIGPLARAVTRVRKISERTPRVLAAMVPLIVGLGVISAVVSEFALTEDRPNPWPLFLAVLYIPATAWAYLAMRRFGERLQRMEPTDAAERVGTLFLGFMVWVTIGIALFAALSAAPDAGDALSGPWLLLIGVGFVSLAHVVFYFFAEPDVPVRAGEVPRPSLAIMIPGTEGLKFDWKSTVRIVVLSATVGLVVWLLVSPIAAPRILGGTGVAMAFVWILSIFTEAASRFVEQSVPPKALEYLGVQRTPVIVLVVAWIWVGATWLPNVGFHDVAIAKSTPSAEAADVRAVAMDDVWQRWLDNNDLPTLDQLESTGVVSIEAGTRPATPMVFVSAWGGGIRAGVWTAYVLDCALEPHVTGAPWSSASSNAPEVCRTAHESAVTSVVAMSGISGGSLGFAEYLAELSLFPSDPERSHVWVEERMGADYLAPSLARLFYVDVPSALVGSSERYRDRGDLLRESWETSWPEDGSLDRGIFDLWSERPDLPLTIMNGTSVNDGCAINTSPLLTRAGDTVHDLECTTLAPFDVERSPEPGAGDFDGRLAATHDLGTFLCPDQDLSLSAAAMMSARFPLISPTGRITRCPDNAAPDHIYTTDGGQLELSGTLTATQLWEGLEPFVTRWNALSPDACIVPVLVHMENGFSEDLSSTASGPPNEWIDPNLFGFTKAKGGLVDNARQREALAFREPLAGVGGGLTLRDGEREVPRFVYIRTRAHPGAAAPLGWTLSEVTIDDLAAQLGQNDEQFAIVADWLSGELECGR